MLWGTYDSIMENSLFLSAGQAGVALTRANTINLVATAPSMHSFDDADWASISGRRDSHTPPNGTRKPDLLRSTSVNVATLQSVYAHRDCTNEVEYVYLPILI